MFLNKIEKKKPVHNLMEAPKKRRRNITTQLKKAKKFEDELTGSFRKPLVLHFKK